MALQASQRAGREAFEAKHPIAATAANVAGSIAGLGKLGMAAGAGKTVIGQGARLAGAGAAAGGVTGFGAGEGNIDERAPGAAAGAAFGAALGAGAPVVSKVASEIAIKPIGRVLVRLFPAGGKVRMETARKEAAQKVLEAFQRDGVTMEDAVIKLNAWAKGGSKPETLMELGGENVKSLAASISNVPGPAKDIAKKFFRKRQEGQNPRVLGDMTKAAGIDASKYLDDVGQLEASQKAAADPLYQAFRAEPGTASKDLAGFMNRPTFKRAIGEMIADAQDRNAIDEIQKVFRFNDPLNGSGVPSFSLVADDVEFSPNLLDRIKRTLDSMVESAKKSNAEDASLKYSRYRTLRNDFRDFMDEKYPNYKAARDAYAGPAAVKDAIEEGYSAGTKTAPDQIRAMLSEMTTSEKEGFKRGFVRSLYEKFGNQKTGIDRAKAFDTPFMEDRIRAVFGKEADSFLNNMGRESEMFQSSTVASPRSGSHTSRLAAGMVDADTLGDVTSIGANVAGGRPISAIASMLRAGKRIEARAMLPETQEELARVMFSTNTPVIVRNLAREKMRLLTQSKRTLGPSAVAGSLAGNAAQSN